MKKLYIFIVLSSITFSSFSQACNSKTNLLETLNSISQKPSVFLSNNYVYIIHPMIKKEDREREYKIKGNLSWEGDSCKIVYTSYKQTKGPESKSTIELGKSFKLNYHLNKLKIFLVENDFKGWELSENLKLDKQQFTGYKSTVTIAGVEKNFEVYLKDNQLYAVSYGFANTGISHEDGAEESANFWYFEKVEDKFRLSKNLTIEASKSNSVPILKKTTVNYTY